MSKHISKDCFYNLPSGAMVHPCRLIHRDGTLMWKHALLHHNQLTLPETEAQEQHIIKTAQRLEELNSWVSQDLEPWEGFRIQVWFNLDIPELSDGISAYFKHSVCSNTNVLKTLSAHIQEHETLEIRGTSLFFRRC